MEKFEYRRRYRLKRNIIVVVISIAFLFIGFSLGVFLVNNTNDGFIGKNLVMTQISEILKENWVDTTSSKISTEDRMINGMVNGLNDPYTSYMTLDQVNTFMDSINGDFVGIGISFVAVDDGALVIKAFKDTPAYNSGVLKGDILTSADGISLKNMSSDDIKAKVVGKENTTVKLGIIRDGKNLEINVVRKAVETDVSYEIREGYGYLNITTFGENSPKHVEDALKEFKKNNINQIVIDLRDNSGGRLDSVQGILNLFIPNNQLMFKMQLKSGESIDYKSDNDGVYSFNHGYILMNNGSASSSEVMIGALTELLNYKTIGTNSYGKGIAQTTVSLSNGNALKYTYAKWLTPKGICIQGEGFKPNYEVKEESINDYAYREFEGELKYDQVSVDIVFMQNMLKRLGYDVDRNDGYFSLKTKEALMSYQRDAGLEVNGTYDYHLAKKLYVSTVVEVLKNSEDQCINKVNEFIK